MSSDLFRRRLDARVDELKWLFYELYAYLPMAERDAHFAALLAEMERAEAARPEALKELDLAREVEPDWYRSPALTGYCLYVKEFAGTLNGVRERLDYLTEAGVNYLHLMPLLDTVDGESDGGYAVSDFRTVKPELGTMADLEALTADCHRRGMVCCMDFVMNHTSSHHVWAEKARRGDVTYQDYYFFYNDRTLPDAFEKTIPEVFPTTAPGSFTFVPETGKWVMTNFYPYQWDLNYGNPAVLREMTANLLYLANRGMDVLRIDAVPYIWKELGTSCRNLPQVHSIVRMVRLICECVCPAVILLGEVVMAPDKLAPYFGAPESPECHMLYNATTMCTIWHTVATQDTRLLRHQLALTAALPEQFTFLNYIRCHDDIGWGLDYPFLRQYGMEEVPHKAFLNAWFAGELPGSPSRGERYNDDPRLGDARMCGTTASLCGLEAADTPERQADALRLDLMLHTLVFFQNGLPVLYAGDEIGQTNDNTYHQDPLKAKDSRYLHRGRFDASAAAERLTPGTAANALFGGIRDLEALRREPAFAPGATVTPTETGDTGVLGLRRACGDACLTAYFNFTTREKQVDGTPLPPHGCAIVRGH